MRIAGSSKHDLLMVVPLGAGKSRSAQHLADLSPAEAPEMSMIHSVAGLLTDGRISRRQPF